MGRGFTAVLVLLTLCVCGVLAADFWAAKKFTDWSDKDVQKMLEDSPWARKTSITMTIPSGGAGRGRGFGMSLVPSQGESMPGGGGMGGDTGMGGGMGGGGAMGRGMSAPALQVTVRWHSALPIKQAVIRERHRAGEAITDDESKLLGRDESIYVAGVIGIPGPGMGLDAKELAASAELRIAGVPATQAANVQIERSPKGTNLYFMFPKKQEGAHVIALGDNEVEFFLKSKTMAVKRKFKLKDMVYEGKLEI